MTLCMVWRTRDNICFASDSRLSFGSNRCDAGIKVSRVPFSVLSVGEPGQADPVVASGDLGMAFAGSASAALMTKVALAEVVRVMQGIPDYHDMGMESISDVMFRGFRVTSRSIGSAIFGAVATCVVFSGNCAVQQRLRAFRMEVDRTNNHSIREVLPAVGDLEVFGSGEPSARRKLPSKPDSKNIIGVLRAVINDPNIDDVGGNIQYGDFKGSIFQPAGVAELGSTAQGVHYWRGPLDLNGPDFDQENGLLPRFPYLNFI
jgi:hypothetical protein